MAVLVLLLWATTRGSKGRKGKERNEGKGRKGMKGGIFLLARPQRSASVEQDSDWTD